MAARRDPFTTNPDPEAWAAQQRVTTTCAFCGESVEALVPDAVAWFARHRQTKHPNEPTRAPRRPGARR